MKHTVLLATDLYHPHNDPNNLRCCSVSLDESELLLRGAVFRG